MKRTALALLFLLSAGIPAQTDSVPSAVPDSAAVAPVPESADPLVAEKLAAAQRAWDESAPESSGTAKPAPSGVGSALLQVVASLILLGLVGGAGLLVVRRARRGSAGRTAGGSRLDLLETRALGPGRQLVLVRVHDRVAALAFAGGSGFLVTEFRGAEAAEVIAEGGDGKLPVREFAATLDSFLDRFRGAPATPTASRGEERP